CNRLRDRQTGGPRREAERRGLLVRVPVVSPHHPCLLSRRQRWPLFEVRAPLLSGSREQARGATRDHARTWHARELGDQRMYLYPPEVLRAQDVVVAGKASLRDENVPRADVGGRNQIAA